MTFSKIMKKIITKPITISSKIMRSCLGEMIDKAYYTHQAYIVTKRKKPMGVYIGFEDYENMINMMDTMAEQLDIDFQQSLIDGKKDITKEKNLLFKNLNKSLQNK